MSMIERQVGNVKQNEWNLRCTIINRTIWKVPWLQSWHLRRTEEACWFLGFVDLCLLFVLIAIALMDLWVLVIVSCVWQPIIYPYYHSMKGCKPHTRCRLIALDYKLGCQTHCTDRKAINCLILRLKVDSTKSLWYKSITYIAYFTMSYSGYVRAAT